jgi:hypothetical protein
MPIVKPDYSKSVNKDFTLQDGWYVVQILDCSVQSGKQGRYLQWELKVCDSETLEDKSRIGIKTRHRTPIEGAYAWVLRNFLEAIDPKLDAAEFDYDDCLGQMIEIQVKNEPSKADPSKVYQQIKQVKSYVHPDVGADFSAFNIGQKLAEDTGHA